MNMYEHAIQEYPNESCGLIINDVYYPCTNIAVNPKETFVISAAERGLLEMKYGTISAIVHSHPHQLSPEVLHRPEWPSSMDMESWISEGIPFWIIACDGVKCDILKMDDDVISPLEGREFIHGYTDCYAIIRDFYRLDLGIKLKNYPRSFEWWYNGQDLYSQNFEDAGFKIKVGRPVRGDVMLYNFSSPVVNHAAICTGDNLSIHHFINKTSRAYPINKLRSNEVLVLEYKG